MTIELVSWLREQCLDYVFDVAGVFHRTGAHDWPLTATGAADLQMQLAAGGHLLPLPKEPAALANVLEVSVVDFLLKIVETSDGLDARRGTERGYPDLEFTGAAVGHNYYAVDVKVARRALGGGGKRTESRITMYTGNTYFLNPDLRWPGTFRSFNDYASHIDVIVIYTLNTGLASRVENLELIIQEAWRIGSRHRSSTTREYIGAVDLIEDLRRGSGVFDTPEAFYKFWRSYPFRVSVQVQRQLARLVREQRTEINELRARERDRERPLTP